MKNLIVIAFVFAFMFPVVASAHPALSQFPISTGRPVVTVPTAPAPSTGGSFSSSGGQCLQNFPWFPYAVTPCWLEIQGMLANLK